MPDEEIPASVDVEVRDNRALLRATGEFDIATAHYLQEALRPLADNGTRQVTIDLERVPFMDSAGLQPIVQFMTAHPSVSITVTNAQPTVAHLFRLHGVDALMTEALA